METKARIIMVTGGQRSGKSVFAETLALGMSDRPTYLATAQVCDDEMRRRVQVHQQRRAGRWRNVESPLHLTDMTTSQGETVLVDCITLWASNWFFKFDAHAEPALDAMKEELVRLFERDMTLILVTNEIGLGGVSENAVQRHFTDLQGAINQFISAAAQEVYLVVSGIPIKIKSK